MRRVLSLSLDFTTTDVSLPDIFFKKLFIPAQDLVLRLLRDTGQYFHPCSLQVFYTLPPFQLRPFSLSVLSMSCVFFILGISCFSY